jgi:hypothetical protein
MWKGIINTTTQLRRRFASWGSEFAGASHGMNSGHILSFWGGFHSVSLWSGDGKIGFAGMGFVSFDLAQYLMLRFSEMETNISLEH